MDLDTKTQKRKRKKKVRWSPAEDRMLLEYVAINGTQSWPNCAQILETRSSK